MKNIKTMKESKKNFISIGLVVFSIILLMIEVFTSSEVEMLKHGLYIICEICFLLFVIVDYLNYVKKYREEQTMKVKLTKEEFNK